MQLTSEFTLAHIQQHSISSKEASVGRDYYRTAAIKLRGAVIDCYVCSQVT